MKKILWIFLSFLCVIIFGECNVSAQENAKFNYENNEEGITITGYNGVDEVVDIPEMIDGKKVTIIGEYAFSGNSVIKKVVIPSTIKRIDKCAFFEAESLSSIKIERNNDNHEIRIESLAMAHCPCLSSIALPKNVTYIADDFVYLSVDRALGTQAWSEELLYLYVETEKNADYVIDRMQNEKYLEHSKIRIITEGIDEPQNVVCHSYGDNKITVEWNHVAGASEYLVYRKIDGDYQYIATVNENHYTEDYSLNNYVYLYKVKAKGTIYGNEDVISKTMGWDAIGVRVADVRNIHALPLKKNAVTLSWNSKDYYVDGYIIYQKNGDEWKQIKKISAIKNNTDAKRSEIISNLLCGKEYTFAVQAYYINSHENNLYSCSDFITYTTTVLVRPEATKIQRITKYLSKYNKVIWNKSNDATGYIVYRSTSKNGEYKKIAVIKSQSRLYYLDKNIKNGCNYYYKVVVYRNVNGKNVRSKASNIVAK